MDEPVQEQTQHDDAVPESVVSEVVDWVEHVEAQAMFEANAGLHWIKTKMHDGIVRMLGRNGETQ